jgi:hypothetical protein
MQSQMVTPLPILRANFGRGMAKPDPPLYSLRQSAETGNASGLGCRRQFFPCSKVVDKDTRLAIASLLEELRESMKSRSEKGESSLQIHDAPVKARMPSYLEVYECSFGHPLSGLTSVENRLAHCVDPGIQVVRNNFAR